MNRLRSASPSQTRVLMVGGTSAGHLAPLVAVAEALEVIEPGITLSFVCSDKPADAAFLTIEKRSCFPLPLPRRNLLMPVTFVRAFAKSFAILAHEKPDVVFSKGSAISVPLCYAARIKGIPIVLHESDAVMGSANKAVAIIATKVCLGANIKKREKRGENSTKEKSDTTLYPLSSQFVVTGNPIRSRILEGKKEDGLRITGFAGTKPVLLVMGGSQGARAINDTVTANLDVILTTCDVIHLTGQGKNTVANKPGYYATEFGSDVLPHLYTITTLAVSRAGAGSIAELAACRIPAILVPIKGLAGDHQVKNAEAAEATGAATVLAQENLGGLTAFVASLVGNSVRMQTMQKACCYAARPEAARLIAETVVLSVAR